MKHVLAYVLLIFSCNLAQTQSIQGNVQSNGEPVPYAVVEIVGTNQKSVTNQSGIFRLSEIPAGRQTVLVSAIGHQNSETILTIHEQENDSVVIELVEAQTDLDK